MAAPLTNSDVPVSDQNRKLDPISAAELGDNSFEAKPPTDPSDPGPAPDGGLRAWLVAAAGFAIFFSCLGFSNAFGALEQYYTTHQLQDESPSNVAWIGSLQVFLQLATGQVGGPLFDRFGVKVMRPAAIAYIFAMMMLSLCKTYWQIMLVQGVLMGIVQGLLQFPAFGAVAQYFDKNRAAAMGVLLAGSSIGGIVMPIALSKMLNGSTLSFGWSVRVIGFVIMPLLGFACFALQARLPPKTTAFWILAAYKETKFLLLIAAAFFMFFGVFTPLFYIPSYAVARGMDATLAGYLSAIVNAASTFGRVIPGILADKYGRLNILAIGGFATAITVFCWNSATTSAGIIVYSVFYGFASGTILSAASTAFSICPKDVRDTGTYMGMGFSICALSVLIGPPVCGALVADEGGYFSVSMFSGAMCLFGSCLVVLVKVATPQGILGKV